MEKNGKRPTNATPFITLSPHLIVYVHRTATGAPMMWYIVCIYTHKYPGVMYVRDLLAGFVIGISNRFWGTGGVRPTICVSCIEMEQSSNPEPKMSNFSGNTQVIAHTAQVSESQLFARYILLSSLLRSGLEQAFRILPQHDVSGINYKTQ